jgi:hypothetical protein
VKSHFERYLAPNSTIEDIWFEINKVPLKWQIPFGVLVDNLLISDYEIPIHIIAHSRSFPDNQLIRFKGMDSLKFQFMNSLKEANTIKYSSSNEVLNLPTQETMKLFEIVFNDGIKMLREYNQINHRFLGDNIDNLKKLPIKLIFGQTEVILNKPLAIYTEKENYLSYYAEYSLGSFLRDNLASGIYEMLVENTRIIIHGVEIDLRLPVLFLYMNFAYMDNYLYITFANKK